MPKQITLSDKENVFNPIIITDIRGYSKTFLHRLSVRGRNKSNRLMINGTGLGWKLDNLEISCWVSESVKNQIEGLKIRQDTRIVTLKQLTANIQLIDEYERLPFESTLGRSIVAGSQVTDSKGNVSGYGIFNVFLDIPGNASSYLGMNLATNEPYYEFKFTLTEE